jgi:hypothetical protein
MIYVNILQGNSNRFKLKSQIDNKNNCKNRFIFLCLDVFLQKLLDLIEFWILKKRSIFLFWWKDRSIFKSHKVGSNFFNLSFKYQTGNTFIFEWDEFFTQNQFKSNCKYFHSYNWLFPSWLWTPQHCLMWCGASRWDSIWTPTMANGEYTYNSTPIFGNITWSFS